MIKRIRIIILIICLLCVPVHVSAYPQEQIATCRTREAAEKFICDSLAQRKKIILFESPVQFNEGIGEFTRNAAKKSEDYLYEIMGNSAYVKAVIPQRDMKTFRYTITMTYHETLNETKYVDRRVNAILNRLKVKRYGRYKKAKLISDWIVANVKYDHSYGHYSAYDALRSGKATCMGYALLTYKMFSAAGIPCKMIRGYASSAYHMWNAVKLNGKYYYVDTCWMDSFTNGRKSNYEYFLFGKTKCKKERTIKPGYDIKNISKKSYRKKEKISHR